MPAAELEPRGARHGQDVAADREGVVGRDQRARAARRLDDDRGLGERSDDAVADGEAPRRRLDARPPLRDDHARRGDARGERGVAPRVVAVDAAAEHRDRAPTAVERAGVSRRVDAERKTADHAHSGVGQLAGEGARETLARRRRRSCADHGDGRRSARRARVRRRPRRNSFFGSPAPRCARHAGQPVGAALRGRRAAPLAQTRSARDQRERLGDVLALDATAGCEVGGGARQAQHSHLAACAQTLGSGRALEQLAPVGRDAEALELGQLEPGVAAAPDRAPPASRARRPRGRRRPSSTRAGRG